MVHLILRWVHTLTVGPWKHHQLWIVFWKTVTSPKVPLCYKSLYCCQASYLTQRSQCGGPFSLLKTQGKYIICQGAQTLRLRFLFGHLSKPRMNIWAAGLGAHPLTCHCSDDRWLGSRREEVHCVDSEQLSLCAALTSLSNSTQEDACHHDLHFSSFRAGTDIPPFPSPTLSPPLAFSSQKWPLPSIICSIQRPENLTQLFSFTAFSQRIQRRSK